MLLLKCYLPELIRLLYTAMLRLCVLFLSFFTVVSVEKRALRLQRYTNNKLQQMKKEEWHSWYHPSTVALEEWNARKAALIAKKTLQTSRAFLLPLFEEYKHSCENLVTLMGYVDSFFKEAGIPYALAGGSLLGAMRSSAILPYDTDIGT